MTTTTTTTPLTASTMTATRTGQAACIRHGLLANGAARCPRCDRQSYRLDDEGDRATLQAFHKTALRSRCRTFAFAGTALAVLAHSVANGSGVHFDVTVAAAGAAAGIFIGWLARSPGAHRLDRALRR